MLALVGKLDRLRLDGGKLHQHQPNVSGSGLVRRVYGL